MSNSFTLLFIFMYGRQLLGVKRRRTNRYNRGGGKAPTTTKFTPRSSSSLSKSSIQRSKVASARFLATLSSRGLAGELKFFDTFVADQTIYYAPIGNAIVSALHGSRSAPSTCYALNAVDAGTADNQRIGKQINMKSLFIRGEFKLDRLMGVEPRPYYCRIVVYMDMQNNNTTPSPSSVIPLLEDTGAGNYNALRNLDYTSRFKVLMDEKMLLVPPVTSTYSTASSTVSTNQFETTIPFQKYVNLNGIKCNFSSTTASSANIVDNAIYVMAFGNTFSDNLASTGYLFMNYSARLRFTE